MRNCRNRNGLKHIVARIVKEELVTSHWYAAPVASRLHHKTRGQSAHYARSRCFCFTLCALETASAERLALNRLIYGYSTACYQQSYLPLTASLRGWFFTETCFSTALLLKPPQKWLFPKHIRMQLSFKLKLGHCPYPPQFAGKLLYIDWESLSIPVIDVISSSRSTRSGNSIWQKEGEKNCN